MVEFLIKEPSHIPGQALYGSNTQKMESLVLLIFVNEPDENKCNLTDDKHKVD